MDDACVDNLRGAVDGQDACEGDLAPARASGVSAAATVQRPSGVAAVWGLPAIVAECRPGSDRIASPVSPGSIRPGMMSRPLPNGFAAATMMVSPPIIEAGK